MTKVSIVADLQFSEQPNLSRILPSGVTSRLQDQLNAWDWMLGISAGYEVDALVVVGDIFDSRTVIDLPVIDTVCRAFERAAAEMRVRIVVGNHDSYFKNPRMNSARAFSGHATVYEEAINFGPFGYVPWMDDWEQFRKSVSGMTSSDYLFTHILVEGAVPKAKGIPLSYLSPKKFKHIFLGDVHEPVVLLDNVRYVGALMQLDFRDAGGVRGFYILDTKDNSLEYIENDVSPRFHIIDDVQTEGIRDIDFVRVESDDPEIAAEATAAAGKKSNWVESNYVELADTKPRLEIRTKDSNEAVLRKYVAHQLPDASDELEDELVALGMDILKEARI